MNAKIGKETEYLGKIGQHSLHDTTDETGTLLIDFAVSKGMIMS